MRIDLSIECYRSPAQTFYCSHQLSTSLSDTYSGEITVSDGAIHIFRDNRNGARLCEYE